VYRGFSGDLSHTDGGQLPSDLPDVDIRISAHTQHPEKRMTFFPIRVLYLAVHIPLLAGPHAMGIAGGGVVYVDSLTS
jgi:hypothetical protein